LGHRGGGHHRLGERRQPGLVLISTDGLRYQATAEALAAWIERRSAEWYEGPIAELEHRGAIREQAIGVAYASQRLEVTARYEVHLDRKLERTLSMLLRLRDLRHPVVAP
jgi:hypothetical protein